MLGLLVSGLASSAVAASFTAASVEPVVWLDAGVGVTTGGTFAWADQSDGGATHDATQTDANRHPSLQANVINGHSVVRLDNVGGAGFPDWLQIDDHADLDIGTAAGKGFTAFFVLSVVDTTQRFILEKRGGDADYSIFNEGSVRWFTGNGEQQHSPIASAGSFHILAFNLDQTGAGSGTKNTWIDGVAADQNPQAYGNKEPDNDQPLYIGRHGGMDNDLTLAGDLAEIIIFNTALNAEDLTSTGIYLADKYGLTTDYAADADGDGVADDADQCAGTPAGEAVDADGCSDSQKDSDNDGVSDADDQCADTPAGATVDADGCDGFTLLAKVGDFEIYERDVVANQTYLESLSETKRAGYLTRVVEGAITNELIYREAKRRGLDQGDEFREQVERATQLVAQKRFELLGGFYESQQQQLVDAKNPESIPSDVVDAYFEQNKRRYRRTTPDMAKLNIRSHLAHERWREVYGPWLKTELAGAEIKVNGIAISSDVTDAVIARIYRGTTAARMSAVHDPLWDKVLEIAGIARPATPVHLDPDARDPLAESLGSIHLSVGSHRMELKELALFSGMHRSLRACRPNTDLFYICKVLVLAEKAKAEGLDKTPEFATCQRRAGRGIAGFDGSPAATEKRLLVMRLTKALNAEVLANPKISDTEIKAYREANEAHFQGILRMANGEARVIDVIRRRLQAAKCLEVRKALVAELRANVTVEIFE
jgi:hypothetical protein